MDYILDPDTLKKLTTTNDTEMELIMGIADDDDENVNVLEEIEEEEGTDKLINTYIKPISPPRNPSPSPEKILLSPGGRAVTREFGNISPISELLDDDEFIDIQTKIVEVIGEGTGPAAAESSEGAGKITPEPGPHPAVVRTSFPRISDGRSSPILAYSPSLLKSPSSNGSNKSKNSGGSPSSNGDRVQKKPRNIARMLDNISDHSSGEEEVNNVGQMMAKFTV